MKIARIGIGLKFAIAITPLIILTMFGVATLIINYQRESLRQSVYESNLSMTKNLANDSVEALLLFDPLRLDELVRTAVEASSCTYAVITDRDGIVVAHTIRKLLGSKLTDVAQASAAHTPIDFKGVTTQRLLEGVPMIEFSFPAVIGEQTLGTATVAFSTESIDQTIGARLSRLKRYIYMITGIMVLAGIIGAFAVSNFLTKPLKKLKDRMLDVQSGNLDVEVENRRIVNCWERLGCEKEACPAYGKTRCWAIAGTFCHGDVQGDFAKKIGDCRKCVVYKESCGDEIHELVEVFNQMVRDLRHNLDQLEKANREKAKMERLSALGEMAATVAHETKNPLNSIRVATSYLKKNFQGEILSEFLSIIDEEIGRLNDITTNFLGFSRPAPLDLKVCDINSVVRPTVELIRQEATDKNVEVVL
ncbi:MAG: histidine kinase dimerization/phospho-acceptor domain-containing protein, partial [Thermodesulfovibrionales bacterium]